MGEVKPVVTDEFDFECADKSLLNATFGSFGPLGL